MITQAASLVQVFFSVSVKQDAGLTDKQIQNMLSSSAGYLIVYLVILSQLL